MSTDRRLAGGEGFVFLLQLARVVGEGAGVEALVADLRADLAERPYEVVAVGEGFLLRTRPAYAAAIRAAIHAPTAACSAPMSSKV